MNKRLLIMLSVIFIPVIIISYLILSGKIRKDYVSPLVKSKMQKIQLTYWRVWDDQDVFAPLISEFNQRHPNITIVYKKLRYEDYEKELIEAFATDRGPDIFSVHNTWLKKYQGKGLISPMPTKFIMVRPYTAKKGLKKETAYQEVTNKFTLARLKKQFVDVVYDNVVIKDADKQGKMVDQIYALPLYVDTLAMYYNRDLFNNASITNPPKYWNREFQQDVKKMTKQNNKGEIMQSGVALGGSNNIQRATDILSILMMQNGTKMLTNGTVTFNRVPRDLETKGFSPGLDALRFYSDFSNPAKEVYCWNNTMGDSLELFMQGKIAMMFSYSYTLPVIKANAPKLNFAIAPLPQIEGNSQSLNFANYWVETVSSKILTDPDNLAKGATYAKNKQEAAWAFLQFITAKTQVESYLEKTKRPTALRDLIDKQVDDNEIGVFAGQVLTSDSWYKGADANAAEKIINEMIDESAGDVTKSLSEVISKGAQKVQQTIYEKN